ncbi:MAG TPA: anthranilate synthase component I family protein, partial [Segetibacter sp.]
QMLNWSNRFNICCFLDNHNYSSPLHSIECLVAAGSYAVFKPQDDFFASLSSFISTGNDWVFGHFNYDIKNRIEPGLSSKNPDNIKFPEAFLFIPKVVLQLTPTSIIIGVIEGDANAIFEEIVSQSISLAEAESLQFTPAISRNEYISKVLKLKENINRGYCYVINFCQEFYANVPINPVAAYTKLSNISPNPFSAYYKLNDKYLLCSSPERYLKKDGNSILSQPIKGTSARDLSNKINDDRSRVLLSENAKERSENVMVVDLVRNDLSKVCKQGTVKVEELFGIYSYPTVHQMISTVKGELLPNIDFSDILQATFPMGSMTGAPKRKVMELIEEYEQTKRGLYSGTLGYISPGGNFDFNVVIRSIFYNGQTNYTSYQVGSAITANSEPEKEYEECLLKAAALLKVFQI